MMHLSGVVVLNTILANQFSFNGNGLQQNLNEFVIHGLCRKSRHRSEQFSLPAKKNSTKEIVFFIQLQLDLMFVDPMLSSLFFEFESVNHITTKGSLISIESLNFSNPKKYARLVNIKFKNQGFEKENGPRLHDYLI